MPYLPKHGDVSACHCLQFSQPWKCSSVVASALPSSLHDGALRIQEHAPGSALNDSPCVREHLFSRLQGGETSRSLSKVSIQNTRNGFPMISMRCFLFFIFHFLWRPISVSL